MKKFFANAAVRAPSAGAGGSEPSTGITACEEVATEISAIAFGTMMPLATASPSVMPRLNVSVVFDDVPYNASSQSGRPSPSESFVAMAFNNSDSVDASADWGDCTLSAKRYAPAIIAIEKIAAAGILQCR